MKLTIVYEGLMYEIHDVEYTPYCPGDRWTPPCPGEITAWGKVFFDGIDVTEVFDSLCRESEVEELLEQEIMDL